MGLRHENFTRITPDEEYDKADIISVKLNIHERRWLEALKRYHQTKFDGTAIKKEAFRVFKQTQEYEVELQKLRH